MQGLRFFLLLFLVMVSQLYNAYSFLFVTLLWLGVTFHSPAILTSVGLTAVGPVAGGMFAAHQGATIAAGSLMAAGQSVAMTAGAGAAMVAPTVGTAAAASVVAAAVVNGAAGKPAVL